MNNNIFNNIYLGEEYSYLRPYISKRNPYDSKVFLVGINPATPITPIQLNIDEYIGLLKNYEEFMEFYSKSRESQNKSKISRTRMGINSLVNWIEQEFNTGVIETDIFTYPTKNIKELKAILAKTNDLDFSESPFPEDINKKGETNSLNWFVNNKKGDRKIVLLSILDKNPK